MGYTIYWNPSELKTPSDECAKHIQNILDKGYRECAIQYEGDIPSEPVFDMDEGIIRFNGLPPNDHETFLLDFKSDGDFGFCKTRQKKYDAWVVAVLTALETYQGFKWSSDGDSEDHQRGVDLFKQTRP